MCCQLHAQLKVSCLELLLDELAFVNIYNRIIKNIMNDMETRLEDNLKEIRKFLGISQQELALRAGLQPSAISNFENGNREPSVKNLIKLSKALGVTTDRLLFGRPKE